MTFEPTKALDGAVPEKAEALVAALTAKLFVVVPRPDTTAALIEVVKDAPAAERVKLACRLILTTPEYQLA